MVPVIFADGLIPQRHLVSIYSCTLLQELVDPNPDCCICTPAVISVTLNISHLYQPRVIAVYLFIIIIIIIILVESLHSLKQF